MQMLNNNNKWYNYESSALPLLGAPSDKNREIVSELNKILEPMGCRISIEEFDRDPDKITYYLYIKVSTEAAADYSRRGAGRKRKMMKKLITVKEVREMLEQRSADSVAAELGVSRSTLFRRLKDRDDECYF